MTRFAPPAVHVCPGCSAFFLQRRFYSINTYGMARSWSDGAPFPLWRQEPLVRCNACAALFWLSDVEPVGVMPQKPEPIGQWTRKWLVWRGDHEGLLQAEAEWAETMKTWGQAQSIGSIGFEDVVYVLSRSKGVSTDRVLWLRTYIWWSLNDRYRRESDESPASGEPGWPAAAERSNMKMMLDMLRDGEATPMSMVRQGELLRLLGRFDEAIFILKAVPPDGYHEVTAVGIEMLARRGDTEVRQLS